MKLKLNNKIILITGVGKGICKEILNKLLKEKNIIYAVTRNINDLKKLKKRKNLFLFYGDITKKEIIDNIFNLAKKNKHVINCLVNNAGIKKDNLLMRMEKEDFDVVVNTNLSSVFNLTKASIKTFLKQRNGSIINISSVVGVKGNAGQSNYSASKAGIIGFSKSIALELGSRNIRSNVVAPGFIETDMTDSLPEDIIKSWKESIPLKRGGNPTDIGNACVFLASDLSSYITGQVLHVDGGMLT